MEDLKNPYRAPEAETPAVESSVEVPPEILKPIKWGWITGIVSGCLTLIMVFTAFGSVEDIIGEDSELLLLDVALIAVMTYGIYRKSRVAATAMFAYYLLSKILVYVELGEVQGAGLTIVFLVIYARAMISCYRYHKFIAQHSDFGT